MRIKLGSATFELINDGGIGFATAFALWNGGWEFVIEAPPEVKAMIFTSFILDTALYNIYVYPPEKEIILN